LAPASLAILILAGCGVSSTNGNDGWNVFNWNGAEFLTLFWTLCALLIPFSLWKRNAELVPDDHKFPTQPLDGYALARLAGSGILPVDAALASLHFQGCIKIDERGDIRRLASTPPSHPFEREVLAAIDATSPRVGKNALQQVRQSLQSAPARFDDELRALGLFPASEAIRRARTWPVTVGWV
jgi:uncharacterized protein (TIGR04222 family)